jgi:flagellar motor switch/type III secretory pathway protein FliN
VWLVGANADAGRRAELTANGSLVIRSREDTSLAWTPETTTDGESRMNRDANDAKDESDGDNATTGALLAALGDAPLVVRVEIGIAEMRAREWAALSPGDVVALGRRIAEPVILRVAGREVARGELVDLEGEIGVRIMSRSEEP